MTMVTVSPKFQIVIPQKIRAELGIVPGQKVQILKLEGRIIMVPVKPIEEMLGYLEGIDTNIEEEPDRL